MAPAVWWGLRCALTFLGELLLGDGAVLHEGKWDAEKRFRVTEVFLAILWVLPFARASHSLPTDHNESRSALLLPTSRFFSPTALCLAGKSNACFSIFPLPVLKRVLQASQLSPLRDFCSAPYDQRIDRVHHFMGLISIGCFGRPANASTSLGVHCHCKQPRIT